MLEFQLHAAAAGELVPGEGREVEAAAGSGVQQGEAGECGMKIVVILFLMVGFFLVGFCVCRFGGFFFNEEFMNSDIVVLSE